MMGQKPSCTVAEDSRGILQLMHHVPEEARPWDTQREVFCMLSMWKAASGKYILGKPAEN